MTYTTLLSSSSINGDTVKNANGDDLGNIKDIMIDTVTGEVAYYVLSFGGFMGLGDTLFALPPQAITVDTEKECIQLNVTKEQLESAEGFDKDNWPNMADPTFRETVYNAYGYSYQEMRRAA